jgi:two-component system, response regulator YesN
MPYKVVFVEDEIVTREGIRDHVDWKANGFEFCGEAPDGEMALPLLQTTRPDLLITDIKMPFMDGLQLCKIVRERMPWIKIVILSGHDEFDYAQQAINLGVTEYLLKPVTVQELQAVLQKIGRQLARERLEQEDLQRLREEVNENRAALRERFLQKLVVGALSLPEAIEQSQALGLDLIARCYLVAIVRVELADRSEQFDYDEYEALVATLTGIVAHNPDVYVQRRAWQELVLIMKGSTPEVLAEDRDVLLDLMQRAVSPTRYRSTVGTGAAKSHLTDICQSFVEALVGMQGMPYVSKPDTTSAVDKAELLTVDRSAVEDYLRSGAKDDFDAFFDAYLRQLGQAALKSYLIKNYLFVDLVLAKARFIAELGGDLDQVVPELSAIETILAGIKTLDAIREQTRKILFGALSFRDSQTGSQYASMIQQVKDYINHHFSDPELSLNEVAAYAHLSPSYFSMVFSQEAHTPFKEYLTEVRIKRAKELLRSTGLRATEISYQVGYSDPHYFSHVFRKNTGLSPTEFRSQAQAAL